MQVEDNSAKRILYVITKATWGGAQRYVYDLAVGMKEHGHEVAVAYGQTGELVARLADGGIRSLEVPALSRDINPEKELRAFGELRKLIRAEHPDIVHVNSSKAGLALLAARLEGVPRVLFTAHGFAFNEKRSWWQKCLLYFAYAATLLLAHETICVSRAVCSDIAFVPFIQKRLIRHGITAPHFLSKEETRARLAAPAGTPLIGIIAELHPSKRVEDVIVALLELPSEATLAVIGDGELREWLAEVVTHYGLRERVRFAGHVPDAAVLLPAFDFFVLPSRTEALGYVGIEAGYAGLPVVATRVGGIPEVIEHKKSGLLVPEENPLALARALRALINNPNEAREYARALHERVTRLFTKERMLAETFEVYGVSPS